jgi:Tfp pilus assembly protein FimT
MVVVLAVVLLIGSIILPTLTGMTGNTKVKGAADAVKARLLEARLNAMDQGRPYVFSVSEDGTKMRVAPDETVEGELSADGQPLPAPVIDEDMPSEIAVKANITDGVMIGDTADGYQILAIFQPDGTCAQDSPDILVQENGVTGVVVNVRGLTGAVSLNKPTTANGGMP